MIKRKQNMDGYILLYLPNHPRAYQTGGYKGWVYEHIIVCERKLKRKLKHSEDVHHLDLRRANNSPENLIVLNSLQHHQLHSWIDSGLPIKGKTLLKPGTILSDKQNVEIKRCVKCGFPLSKNHIQFCSIKCTSHFRKVVDRPNKEQLANLLSKYPWTKVGKMFNVSDNAIRKWAKGYGLNVKLYSRGKIKKKKFTLYLKGRKKCQENYIIRTHLQ